MVAEVDKQDTHARLSQQRETIEAARQEILSWVLPKEQTTNDGEAQALRKLAVRSAQQARQWTGRMLAELGVGAYPYANSVDATTQVIDKTAVPQVKNLDLPAEYTVVQRIKAVRVLMSEIKNKLEELLDQCIPGSFFNQCLFDVQRHAVQTGMWLGELLHEFYEAQPKQEAEAPKNDATPTPSTTSDSSKLAMDEVTLTESGQAVAEPREFTAEEGAADLATIQADSEPGDQFKANLEAGAAIAEAEAAGESSPLTSPDNNSPSTQPKSDAIETGSESLSEAPDKTDTGYTTITNQAELEQALNLEPGDLDEPAGESDAKKTKKSVRK